MKHLPASTAFARAPITLLTDFGTADGYAGAMKGVLASLAPGVPVIDISHDIPPQSIRRAGLVWRAAAPWFPPGTIHVGVVDPGVGSRRRILAFRARGQLFLAPDNGMIGYAVERGAIRAAVEVKRRGLFLKEVSRTFHGRDIFAPVAARLALGLELEELGPRATEFLWESLPAVRRRRRGGELEVAGEVVDIDRFGNAMTSLEPLAGGRLLELAAGGTCIPRLSKSYGAVPLGRPLAIVGSQGYIEVAVNCGHAARALGLRSGDRVVARWLERSGPEPAGRRRTP
jgi:S-adenosylmethionine hydrolase